MSNRRYAALRCARLATAEKRCPGTDRFLGVLLALIAGGTNAGGFLLLSQYISHMTGHLSNFAEGLVLTNVIMLLDSVTAVISFVLGAALSAAMISWGRSHHTGRCYAAPLRLQGALLVALSALVFLPAPAEHRVAMICVCFVMGLQNATITRISGARIRTSHATGLITDMGIEIGRAIYRLFAPRAGVVPDESKLWLYVQLVFAFIAGGVIGSVGYSHVGWPFAIPGGLILILLTLGNAPRKVRQNSSMKSA